MIQVVTELMEPKNALEPLDLNNIEYIMLHHAEKDNCTWQDINTWHKANGWSCGGYNEFIAKDGTVYIMRGDHQGAHCTSYNDSAYGICCEGDYHNNSEPMPEAQFKALVGRIKYHFNRLPKIQGIVPHKMYYPTECPGQYFPFDEVVKEVAAEMNIAEAIVILQEEGIITSPEYWTKAASVVKWLDVFMINVAEKLEGAGK